MKDSNESRRAFLRGAMATGAAAASTPLTALGQQPPAAKPAAAEPEAPAGYQYLRPAESAFVESLVDHMVPADALSPSGTQLGINIYIDRALAGGWGKGDRLYRQGPWRPGLPTQGYQLPYTPAELMRAGIEATNAFCRKTYGGKPFDQVTAAQREELLKNFDAGKVTFDSSLRAGAFWGMLYQLVMEGMFSDPIYGGNRNKAAWKMIGFPGVVATHAKDIVTFKGKPYTAPPQGIADLS